MANLVIPAKLENLEKMFVFLREAAKAKGFDDKEVNRLQLACEEALVNVISYAYPEGNGDIEIRCESQSNGLEVKIIDSGIAFDPLSLADPDINAPLEQRKIGGLGVFLIKKIMDKVYYERAGNQNILTLFKTKN